jgi:uncharacterized protein (TIGR03083 family)
VCGYPDRRADERANQAALVPPRESSILAGVLSVRAFARQELQEFADLLDGLSAQQWTTPSLCAGWTAHDVAAHTIAYLGQRRMLLAHNMLRLRGDTDRLNAEHLESYAALAPEQLAARMRSGVEPSGAGALYGCRVALIECLIHQQDIRRPLGLPRTIPEQRLRASLNYARISPIIGGARRTRGLRLQATDMNWSAGRGPEVRGPGEALLLAVTGRTAAVTDELSGDGAARLR